MPTYAELKKQFDWVSSFFEDAVFTPHPSCEGVATADVSQMVLKHFDRPISSEDAIKEMEKEGIRPATFEELLAYAKANPDEQRKFPIVALGSETDVYGDRSVAFLWLDDSGRDLRLGWFGSGWRGRCRFLAVRKESSALSHSDAQSSGTLTLPLFIRACEAFINVLKEGK